MKEDTVVTMRLCPPMILQAIRDILAYYTEHPASDPDLQDKVEKVQVWATDADEDIEDVDVHFHEL